MSGGCPEEALIKALPEQMSCLEPIDWGIRGDILEFLSVFGALEAVSMLQGHTGPRPS